MSSLLRSECRSRFQSYQQLSIGDVLDAVHQSQAPIIRRQNKNQSAKMCSPESNQVQQKTPQPREGRSWFKTGVVDERRRSKVQQRVKFYGWVWQQHRQSWVKQSFSRSSMLKNTCLLFLKGWIFGDKSFPKWICWPVFSVYLHTDLAEELKGEKNTILGFSFYYWASGSLRASSRCFCNSIKKEKPIYANIINTGANVYDC